MRPGWPPVQAPGHPPIGGSAPAESGPAVLTSLATRILARGKPPGATVTYQVSRVTVSQLVSGG